MRNLKKEVSSEVKELKAGNVFRVGNDECVFLCLARGKINYFNKNSGENESGPQFMEIGFVRVTPELLGEIGFNMQVLNVENRSALFTLDCGYRIFKHGDRYCDDNENKSTYFEYVHELQELLKKDGKA